LAETNLSWFCDAEVQINPVFVPPSARAAASDENKNNGKTNQSTDPDAIKFCGILSFGIDCAKSEKYLHQVTSAEDSLGKNACIE